MERKEVEVTFDGLQLTIVIEEPTALFRVIKALQNDGRDPEIRYFDEEIDDKTCWQPTQRAACHRA